MNFGLSFGVTSRETVQTVSKLKINGVATESGAAPFLARLPYRNVANRPGLFFRKRL